MPKKNRPLRSSEMTRCAAATSTLLPGDIVLGDRGLCSYAFFAILLDRGQHGVFRAHQRLIVDFTPGRPQAKRSKGKKLEPRVKKRRPKQYDLMTKPLQGTAQGVAG